MKKVYILEMGEYAEGSRVVEVFETYQKANKGAHDFPVDTNYRLPRQMKVGKQYFERYNVDFILITAHKVV